MSETYEHDDYQGATVYEFPHRDADGDDGLGVPGWVIANAETGGPRLSQAATDDHAIEGVIVGRDAGPSRAVRRIRKRQTWARTRAVLGHPATRGGGRQLVYLALGLRVAGRRAWQSRTTALHDQAMRDAMGLGDHVSALEWEERRRIDRFERHERRMQLLTVPVHAARAVVAGSVGGAFLLLVTGIALWINSGHFADIAAPFTTGAAIIKTVADIVQVAWRPVLALALVASVLGLWQAGRNDRGRLPVWLAPAGELTAAPDDSWITPSIVVLALRDLGISPLRKWIVDAADGAGAMLGPMPVSGCGIEVDVTLPRGVPTTDIVARHHKLAENLGRHPHELYIEVPQGRGQRPIVRLWIADAGALDEPIGPSPLVTDPDMTVNFISGTAPWGLDRRRNPVGLSLYQRHGIFTGLSNHGKTATVRAFALWAALDPIVEFWIADLKGVGDWGMFDALATTLIQGPTDAHVIAATRMVEAAVTEMEYRLQGLQDANSPDGVTEAMARKPGSGFHPLLVIVDEAQLAIMCPAVDSDKNPYGGFRNTSRFFTACRKLQNQGRAVNVTLVLGTQDPNPQNFPLMLRNGAHLRAALPLGSEGQSKMVLGEDLVKAGAAPHRLRRGIDKGVVVVGGEGVAFPAGAAHMTAWTYFVSGTEAHAIAERAKTRRAAVTSHTGADDADGGDQLPDLDVLADVAAVLGDAARLSKQEAMLRLAERDGRYRTWTDAQLKAALEAAGAPQYTYNGVTHVHGDRVREALARRFSATE